VRISVAWGVQPAVLIRAICPLLIGIALYRMAGDSVPRSALYTWLAAGLLGIVLWLPWRSAAYDLACVFVAFPAIILIAVRSREAGWLARACAWLGLISYPIYAVNQPLLRMAKAGQLSLGAQGAAALAIDVLIALAVVAISHMLATRYDAPVRKWVTGLVRRRTSGHAAAGRDKEASAT
jgi:peptidoglycan/LPS O-acetylase OafA/YrhL